MDGLTPQQFAERMQRELDNNAPKRGNWAEWKPTPQQAISELDHHVTKLKAAIFHQIPAQVDEHTADVANICMKIAEMNDGEKDLDAV